MFLSILSQIASPFNANPTDFPKKSRAPGILERFTSIEQNIHLPPVKSSQNTRSFQRLIRNLETPVHMMKYIHRLGS